MNMFVYSVQGEHTISLNANNNALILKFSYIGEDGIGDIGRIFRMIVEESGPGQQADRIRFV